ncbi:WD40-repeat-containing domain protein [Lanmaoa asiatica]|nr:WD40-repeat-containing domain protein [Lanmaoa asiatica]
MATIAVPNVRCLAVSKDGRWIAAGTELGDVFVWDSKTYEQVFSHKEGYDVNGVDFSPDSTRLAIASDNCTASVWDVATRKRVVAPLHHEDLVIAAKYSPQGDRIATATDEAVRVYDSNDGRLLVLIPAAVTPLYNTGLFWLNNQLFIVSDGKINQVEASTGSAVSEWPVLDTKNYYSCIALPQHGEFIAYATKRTVTFWDTPTHLHLGLIQHTRDRCSIALSSDDRFLAIGGKDGEITINNLSRINEPKIHINDAVLNSWDHDQLANAEALLTQEITESRDPGHHVLASRALVRAHLRHWEAAIVDATKSINIRPTVIGYIAKSIALVGNGERHEAYRACDIAFEHFHSTHVSFLLLIKVCPIHSNMAAPSAAHIAQAIIVFMAGEHNDCDITLK